MTHHFLCELALRALTLPGVAFLLASAVEAHGPAHSQALINDPRSHGTLGDNLLSLDEAIQLNQRLITQSQLSPAEQNQLQGFGNDIAWAAIDFTVVPRITFERDLTPINDQQHGLVISGSNGSPVIDISGTNGFVATSNWCDFRALTIQGGSTAITLTQTSAVYGTVIESVTFQGQSSTGVRINLTADGGTTQVQFDKAKFVNVPTAIEVFDIGQQRLGSLSLADTEFQGGQLGLGVHLGPNGGSLNVTLDRVTVQGTTTGIAFDRASAANNRAVALNSLHLTTQGGTTGLSFQGDSAVPDFLQFLMADLSAQGQSLRLWPLGAAFNAVVDDSRLSGGIELQAGATGGILVANARAKNGTLDLGSTGAPVRVTDSILDTLTTRSVGSTGVQIDACRFVQGSVTGGAAPVTVSGCHLGGVSVGANVSVSNSLPAPQLGSLEITPLTVPIATSMVFQADLPPGLSGIWVFGLAETLPLLGPRPIHLYFFLSAYVTLPVVVRLQQQFPVPVPNDSYLIGFDFVGQMAVLPDSGTAAPPLSLPPGRRVMIR